MNFLIFIAIYATCSLAIILFVWIISVQNKRFHKRIERFNQLGAELLRNGHPDSAIAAFRRAVLLNPHSAVSHYNLGMALSENKESMQEALWELNKAIRIEPLNAEFYARRAELYLRKSGDMALAQADFQKSCELRLISIDPDFPAATGPNRRMSLHHGIRRRRMQQLQWKPYAE
jgi:tetratricopeptide (TPR) repeat protein